MESNTSWTTESLKATATNTRIFDDVIVSFEMADTEHGFYHRLVCAEHHTEWSRFYEGLDTLVINGRTFIAGTCYGLLPVAEIPMELIYSTEPI